MQTQTQVTQVEWVETQTGTTRHGLAQIGDVEARTVESRPGAPYWSVEARARPEGPCGPEVVVRVSSTEWTLDEARAAAVERATWAAAALARAMGPDLAASIRQAQASVDEARAADDRGEWAEPETVACSSLGQLAALVGGAS